MEIGEQRQHPRRTVVTAILIAPNGDRHGAQVLDLSAGGARVGLSDEWQPRQGMAVRMFFLLGESLALVLGGQVTRVAVDHLGVQFAPDQDEAVRRLLEHFDRSE